MQTIKYFSKFLFVLIPLFGYGQTNSSLSEILWSRVKTCHSLFEDMDDDGKADFDKIDDSKNGYLKISGSWPTCGCSCSSTVAAYKNQTGEYVILQSDEVLCSWERKVSSNKDLKDILPLNFGADIFASGQINEKVKYPVFFLDFEIPRIGTDTKVTIKLIPFGIKPQGGNVYCYEYKEQEGSGNCKSLFRLKDIAKDIQDSKTLDLLISGNFDKISPSDNKVIHDAIGDDDSRFKSKEELVQYLQEIKQIFEIYLTLGSTEFTMGWNRQESRFFIKTKGGKPENISFREFLMRNDYWSPVC